MASRIAAALPPGAVEIASARTRTGKLFQRGPGRFTAVHSIGPMHVPSDVGAWKRGEKTDWIDPDPSFEPKGAGEWGTRSAFYDLAVLKDGIGYRYTSRIAGTVSVRLVALDGNPLAVIPQPRVVGDTVFWDEVAKDLDIYLNTGVVSAEIFKRLKSDAAPRSFTWEIEESVPQVLNLKIQTAGQDNEERLDQSRVGLGPGWARRWVELVHSQTPYDTSVAGVRKFQVTEAWTGRTYRYARTEAREKEFFSDYAYPVLIDQDVSEAITATGDDGFQQGTTTWWVIYATGVSIFWTSGPRRPGFRFQTVAIPNGATIDDATFTITVSSAAGSATSGTLFGNDVDDAPAWATSAGPQNMTPTTASTAWNVPDATGAYAVSVAGIVAEITSRAGWASGNDLSLGVQGTVTGDYKYFWDFEHGSSFATLVVNYTEGGGGSAFAGTGEATASLVGASQAAATFSGAGEASVSLVGAPLTAGTLAGAGEASGAFTGAASTAATLAAAGEATATFSGAPQAAAVLSAPGEASAAFTGLALVAGVLSGTGEASVSFVGEALGGGSVLAGTGDSSGVFVGSPLAAAVLAGSGDASVAFIGRSDAAAVWAAAADSTGSLVGEVAAQDTGVLGAAGEASGIFVGAALAGAVLQAVAEATAAFQLLSDPRGRITCSDAALYMATASDAQAQAIASEAAFATITPRDE